MKKLYPQITDEKIGTLGDFSHVPKSELHFLSQSAQERPPDTWRHGAGEFISNLNMAH